MEDNFCHNCGAAINPDDSECSNCLTKLKSNADEKTSEGKSKTLIIIVSAVAVVLFIVLIIVLINVFGMDKGEGNNVSESEPYMVTTTEIQDATTEMITEEITEPSTEAVSESPTEPITEEIQIDYYKTYKSTIDAAADKSTNDGREYFLFDIDSDGINELIVEEGGILAEASSVVYTINDGASEYLGAIEGSNSGELSYDGSQLYYTQMLQGFQRIYKVNKIGNIISSELMFENMVSEYASYGTVLEGCPLNEEWLLKGEAKPENISEETVIGTVRTKDGVGLNLRISPDTNAEVIVMMPENSEVIIEDYFDGWCYVRYNGEYGYAASEYLSRTVNVDSDTPLYYLGKSVGEAVNGLSSVMMLNIYDVGDMFSMYSEYHDYSVKPYDDSDRIRYISVNHDGCKICSNTKIGMTYEELALYTSFDSVCPIYDDYSCSYVCNTILEYEGHEYDVCYYFDGDTIYSECYYVTITEIN